MQHAVFFTHIDDEPELAERIQRGLEMARDDGSLDKLFAAIPNFLPRREELKKRSRRVIELKAPE